MQVLPKIIFQINLKPTSYFNEKFHTIISLFHCVCLNIGLILAEHKLQQIGFKRKNKMFLNVCDCFYAAIETTLLHQFRDKRFAGITIL